MKIKMTLNPNQKERNEFSCTSKEKRKLEEFDIDTSKWTEKIFGPPT